MCPCFKCDESRIALRMSALNSEHEGFMQSLWSPSGSLVSPGGSEYCPFLMNQKKKKSKNTHSSVIWFQESHFKNFTKNAGNHSWLTVTLPCVHSWLNSKITSWFVPRRYKFFLLKECLFFKTISKREIRRELWITCLQVNGV